MTKQAMAYNDFGIRTLRGVYWITTILVVLMTNVIIIQALQTGQHHVWTVWTASKLVWVLAVFLNTVRILNRLKKLEVTRQEPDDDMKLMFHLASMFPIVGYLPFFLCFR